MTDPGLFVVKYLMIWPWTRGGENKLLDRVEALEKAVEASESRIRLLKNEWEDVLDRANRVMGRLNARIRKFEGQNGPPVDDQVAPQGQAPEKPQGAHATLSAMRRRRSGLLPG